MGAWGLAADLDVGLAPDVSAAVPPNAANLPWSTLRRQTRCPSGRSANARCAAKRGQRLRGGLLQRGPH